MTKEEKIRQRLESLEPIVTTLVDDSARHAGHAGARDGGSHFQLQIVSAQFSGKTTVARHRMIYSALGDMMKHDIHALNILALAPDETDLQT
ncbi:MAG: BolA family transcriptional regulator [Gallionella sp.]|jgi:BolA protein|nr:BolA family transcriptional regulator [Gallionella sp.]